MGLDLAKLRVFVAVVEHNGFSAAADHLGLSQSTVSFHVQSLERHLEASLVRYEQRSLRLTPAGEQVYRRAKRMLRDEQRLMRSIRDDHPIQVTLGVSIAFEQPFFFDKVLEPYRRAHPDVLLSVRFGRSVGLAEAVLDDELDLAYVLGWQVPTNVRYEPLHQTRFTLLVARSDPLARAATVTAAQVARAGLITAPLDDVEWVHYERVLREIDLGPSDTTLEINGIQARFLAAAAGMGVVGVFRPADIADDADETLTALRMDRPMPSVEAGLVSRRSDAPAAAVQALADSIRRQGPRHGSGVSEDGRRFLS